jgi:hypothetical protein
MTAHRAINRKMVRIGSGRLHMELTGISVLKAKTLFILKSIPKSIAIGPLALYRLSLPAYPPSFKGIAACRQLAWPGAA